MRSPPWEPVEVDWYGGQRTQLWVFAHTALWDHTVVAPGASRYVLVADLEGKLRLEAFFCTDLNLGEGYVNSDGDWLRWPNRF